MHERRCTYCGQDGHRAHACPRRARFVALCAPDVGQWFAVGAILAAVVVAVIA